MAENISTQHYYDAATKLFTVAGALSRVHSSTMNAIADTGSMAGTDDRGVEFADEYDSRTSDFEYMGRNLAPAVQNYGRILLQMGVNHAQAETDSNVSGPNAITPPPDPGELTPTMCSAVPSSAGADGDGLSEALGLLQHIGVQVPNGDTDKLRTAMAAWEKVANDSDGSYRNTLQSASDSVSELSGEEVDIVIGDLEELNSVIEDYAELAGALKSSVEAHLSFLDYLRDMIKGLLEDLLVDLAVTAAVGIFAAVVTVGVGAAAAAAKGVATVARYGKKVESIISDVKKIRGARKISELVDETAVERSNASLTRILQMERRTATSQGQRNNLTGRIGELKAGIDPDAPKVPIQINGRTRIPDEIDDAAAVVREVKNTNSIGATQQIKDMIDYAHSRGYTVELIVDNRTKLSGPLQQLVDNGEVVIKRMDLN